MRDVRAVRAEDPILQELYDAAEEDEELPEGHGSVAGGQEAARSAVRAPGAAVQQRLEWARSHRGWRPPDVQRPPGDPGGQRKAPWRRCTRGTAA
jgi:hypothetical protein